MSLWDLYQHAQLRGMRRSQTLADHGALVRDKRHEREVDELEERVEQLGTVVEALWVLCRSKLDLEDEHLVNAVDEVLERRRVDLAPVPCPQCGAAVIAELDHCQFCGADSPRPKQPFHGL